MYWLSHTHTLCRLGTLKFSKQISQTKTVSSRVILILFLSWLCAHHLVFVLFDGVCLADTYEKFYAPFVLLLWFFLVEKLPFVKHNAPLNIDDEYMFIIFKIKPINKILNLNACFYLVKMEFKYVVQILKHFTRKWSKKFLSFGQTSMLTQLLVRLAGIKQQYWWGEFARKTRHGDIFN